LSAKLPSVSAFFPAYNDAPSLPTLIERTFAVLSASAGEFEVIVVNDGSTDGTAEVLRELQLRFGPRLRVVEHAQNRGYGAALRTGLEAAHYDFVFYTDADGQYDVRELPLLIILMRDGVGLVNGYKLTRHDPWHRICIGWLYNRFARALFGIALRDIDCDFRLIRRGVLQSLDLRSDTGSICVKPVRGIELSGCGVVEVGVHHHPRLHGRSQFFCLHSLLRTTRQLLDLYWRLILLPRIERLRSVSPWARP
jgi:glycosyltransferase involved in cell wall biosynthesis